MTETQEKKELFFHYGHGLCRAVAMKQAGTPPELNYVFEPVSSLRGKIRFTVPASALEESGFNKLMNEEEGRAILEYFKTGKKEEPAESPAWNQAMLIWAEAYKKETKSDRLKCRELERAIKSLAGTLAYVLETSVKEMTAKIQRSLGRETDINPMVVAILAGAGKASAKLA